MFQTTNLDAHAYTSESLISLHNDKCSPEMIEYIKNTYSYTIPQNNYRTLIINKNVFRTIAHFNLFVISPEIFDDNPMVVLNIMINYLSNLIKSMNKNSKLANMVDFKLYLYYGDNIEMPFAYVKDDLYDEDLFGNKINHKLRLYIRNFRFTEEGELKFHLPLNQDTFSQLIQTCHKTTLQSQPSQSQPSFIQPSSSTQTTFIQPSQPSQSFIQPSSSTQSTFIQPSQQPSQTSFIQPSQPFPNTFSKSTSFSSNPPSINTFTGSNPFNAVKSSTTFPNTFGIK